MKKRRLQKGVYLLPEELMVKILERLPTKSLIRFTSVSKRWRSIILDPEFAKSHFRIIDSDHRFPRHVTLFFPEPGYADSNEEDFDTTYLDFFSYSSPICLLKFPFIEQPSTSTGVTLLSSCNGLLCALVHPENHLYIWNPATNLFRKLPQAINYSSFERETLAVHGFGYVSASNEYKLVAKLESGVFFRRLGTYSTPMFIFSSKTNVWRKIRVGSELPTSGPGILSHENLHWLTESRVRIVAFDLAREEFRAMPVPKVNVDTLGFLSAYGDTLCVFDMERFSTSRSIHIWVMKEYGAGDSWVRQFKLRFNSRPENIVMLRPIFVHETSTFLLKRTVDRRGNSELRLIRSFHNEDKFEGFVLSPQKDYTHVISYRETLLSFD